MTPDDSEHQSYQQDSDEEDNASHHQRPSSNTQIVYNCNFNECNFETCIFSGSCNCNFNECNFGICNFSRSAPHQAEAMETQDGQPRGIREHNRVLLNTDSENRPRLDDFADGRHCNLYYTNNSATSGRPHNIPWRHRPE